MAKKISNVNIALFFLFVSLVILNLKFKDFFAPKDVVPIALDSSCFLHQDNCSLDLPGGGKVTVSIEPKPIPLTVPIKLTVTVQNRKVDKVEVDFTGVDMNMGFNRTQLKQNTETTFSGEMILPVCIRNKMKWEAKVVLRGEDESLLVPFRFITYKK